MSMYQDLSLVRVATLSIIGGLAFLITRTLFVNKKLPAGVKPLPGPKGLPLVGSAFDLPKSHAWLKFTEWADEYGPIYQVTAFGTTMVIISKESIANELLSLRGAIYSDRPSLIMAGLITDHGFLGSMVWGDYWRRARRYVQTMLSTNNVQLSVPKQTIEARQMVVDLGKNPAKYGYWLERAGVMISLKQVYGITEERGPIEEHHVHEICSYMEEFDRLAAVGHYLVDFIPALIYVPSWLAPFKREAAKLVKKHWNYLSPLIQHSRDRYSNSQPQNPESFVRRYLKSPEEWSLSEREIVWVLSSIFGGASGTSATAMQSIILNTCLFPEWQTRMHDEIESVVGPDRLPTYEDLPNLPTVRAVIKESMRWRPVLSGGFPHAVTKDDIYKGYHIPRGAIVIPNQWAILRDPSLYPSPSTFNPDRYLLPSYPTYQSPLSKYPNLKRFAAFGHGRRICPGLEVAEISTFLQTASLYWACEIRKKKDEQGKDVDVPWYDYLGGAISTPRHFEFEVVERVKGRLGRMEEVARREFEEELGQVRRSV